MKTFIATAALMLAATTALADKASTFQNTCSNIGFTYTGDGGAEIIATCLRADGSPNETSIAMPGIENQNGQLVMAGDKASFQQSCGSIALHSDIEGVVLTAACRTSDGAFNMTEIAIPNIGNDNGKLVD